MDKPNILIILSDQHHPRMLGVAGDPVLRTPNLDALARKGVRFDQAYCAAPLCVPSRMTFMTSRTCSTIEVWSNKCLLQSDIPTFAHTLGVAGYETVLCGRMHFEGPDQMHGFERRLIGDFTRNYRGLEGVTLAGLPAGTGQSRSAVATAGPGRTSIHAYDEAVTDAACRFIAGRQPGQRPWCMVVGYYLPHSPFFCPKALFDEYHDRIQLPEVSREEAANRHPAIHDWLTKRNLTEPLTEQQVRNARAAYYGMVTQLDANVGRVLASLDQSAQCEHTLRLYLSDHGEMAGEHGMWWKSNFYESAVGVPMIWSWPGVLPQGVKQSEVVSLLDVGPTLEAFAQFDGSHPVDGRSLMPLLMGEPENADWPNEITAELAGAKMIRSGPWKMVVYHGYEEPQLFNLESDPGELHDRSGDPECAKIRQRLSQRIRDGWHPEEIRKRLKQRDDDGTLLHNWAVNAQPTQPWVWSAPDGVNAVDCQ